MELGEVPHRPIAFVVTILSFGYVVIADHWWDGSTRHLIGWVPLVATIAFGLRIAFLEGFAQLDFSW